MITHPGLSIVVLLISYVLPFCLAGNLDWMPCIRDTIPSKPLLVAHRGAVGLAPENTEMAFESAVSSGSYGLESDLQVSIVSFSLDHLDDYPVHNQITEKSALFRTQKSFHLSFLRLNVCSTHFIST